MSESRHPRGRNFQWKADVLVPTETVLGNAGRLISIQARDLKLDHAPTTARYPKKIYYRILPPDISRIHWAVWYAAWRSRSSSRLRAHKGSDRAPEAEDAYRKAGEVKRAFPLAVKRPANQKSATP